MHGPAVKATALGARSAVVFRPFLEVGAGVEPATYAFAVRCSTTALPTMAVKPGVEPGPLRATDASPFPRFRQGGMCGTDGRIRMPHTGGVHEPQACERLPYTTDSAAPEPFSSGAIRVQHVAVVWVVHGRPPFAAVMNVSWQG